jgi:hypothetical protein
MARLLLTLLLFTLMAFAEIPLTKPLVEWKRRIEASGAAIYIARVVVDRASNQMTLEESGPGDELAAEFLGNEESARQFLAAQAMTVSRQEGGRQVHLVLLNGERRLDAAGEEAVLAHEFGHAWLRSQGYAAPVYRPGPAACLAIHAADLVQHVLIRRELAARGLDHRLPWIPLLDEAVRRYQALAAPPQQEPCQRLLTIAQWVDTRLGSEGDPWPGRERFEQQHRRLFGDLEPAVAELCAYLKAQDLEDKAVHAAALRWVHARLQRAAVEDRPLNTRE